jgi:hypothetical protein
MVHGNSRIKFYEFTTVAKNGAEMNFFLEGPESQSTLMLTRAQEISPQAKPFEPEYTASWKYLWIGDCLLLGSIFTILGVMAYLMFAD